MGNNGPRLGQRICVVLGPDRAYGRIASPPAVFPAPSGFVVLLDGISTICAEQGRGSDRDLSDRDESQGRPDGGGASHDRDSTFARNVDGVINGFGMRVLKSPPRSPMANAVCERLIWTIRRECLDWLIPISEAHLRSILKSWAGHYNSSRPRIALGRGVPDPPANAGAFQTQQSRHRTGGGLVVLEKSVLEGLHHEYSLARAIV
jgi:hypothetical protein